MKYFIITGTSRGLGEAIAKQLLNENNHIFCISRSINAELVNEAKLKKCKLDYFKFDLSITEEIPNLIDKIFSEINLNEEDSIYLINNAGVIKPIKPIEDSKYNDIALNVNINLIAPMILVSNFIKKTEQISIEKRILSITSGAAVRPFDGWSTYCASKAGINMFTKTVAIEQERKDNNLKIAAFSPGIIDTSMQGEIRNSKEEDFSMIDTFINFKKDNKLRSPKVVAEIVLKVVCDKNFTQGEIYNIKDLI